MRRRAAGLRLMGQVVSYVQEGKARLMGEQPSATPRLNTVLHSLRTSF
jgi:hypothetical protein